MRVIRFLSVVIVALSLILLSVDKNYAAAPKYPTKPIQVVVAFAPGDTDVILRPFVEKMPDYLGGQPMTIVYKPGAAGALGATFVVNANPDGHTLLGSTQSAMVVIPLTQQGVSYTLESFTPICVVAESYPTLWVQANARWKNLPELVAEAKKSPGMINFTSPGTMAIQHLLVEAFASEAGIKLNHIPAQGGATQITALLGGHVDMAVSALNTGLPHVQSGALRPLGIFSPKRARALPDAPTLLEQGYRVDTPMIYGFVGPKNTPREVVEALSSAARKVIENHKPFLHERYDKLGAEIRYLSPEEYGANMRAQRDLFSKIVKGLTK
jgi:tripartite-type tricarboxylate transporter receptor subunit TctC